MFCFLTWMISSLVGWEMDGWNEELVDSGIGAKDFLVKAIRDDG